MTNNEAAKIIQNQQMCIKCEFKKKCVHCRYYVSGEEKIQAFDIAAQRLISIRSIKREFFVSGIEYAKSEFIRLLNIEKENVGDLHKSKVVDDLIYTQVLGLQKAIELAENVTNKLDEIP